MKTNTKPTKSHMYSDTRLAGGYGPHGAKQSAEMDLRRLVLSCLLWEDIAYADGKTVADQITKLVPLIDPEVVRDLAVEARSQQKLRHVPLLLAREMCRYDSHKQYVADLLQLIINRPDELTEFLSIYWKLNGGKKTICSQAKRGLSKAFLKFNEYQLAKWNRSSSVKLKDVMRLVHPKAKDAAQGDMFRRLMSSELATPDTWEVGISAAKSSAEKRDVWTRLITENKLGALAFLKNLRNMVNVGVDRNVINDGLENIKPTVLLPIDFIRAADNAPDYLRQIEKLMFRCLEAHEKIPGWTIFVVDVSGSMDSALSSKTDYTRLSAATAMTILASEVCEDVTIYATAGSDSSRKHATTKIKPMRGFALADQIAATRYEIGQGGIFTRQCLEYIRTKETGVPDRIIIFSDSQDCDRDRSKLPAPFGKNNFIVDVSSNSHGVNYDGIWSAEISGWSENFIKFICNYENSGKMN